MAKIIKVDIENFSYGEETILQDIHFSVEKGEFIVITGLSGCGDNAIMMIVQ